MPSYTPIPQISDPTPNPASVAVAEGSDDDNLLDISARASESTSSASLDLLAHKLDPSDIPNLPKLDDSTAYISSHSSKHSDVALLDPESFRRLSISTTSSLNDDQHELSTRSRGRSAQRGVRNDGSWRAAFQGFCKRNEALFFVTAAQFFGAIMNLMARLLEEQGSGLHPFQILFVRQFVTMILCSTWLVYKHVPGFPLGPKGVRLWMVVRAVFGFFGIYGVYYSLQYLPLADAVVITFLTPSVAGYGCSIFLKEPFPRAAQWAGLISIVGVVLIARPSSFFSSSSSSAEAAAAAASSVAEGIAHVATNTTIAVVAVASNATAKVTTQLPSPTTLQRLSAILFSLVGVLGAAGALTSLRWIGPRAHPLISVNYFAAWCTLISVLAMTLARPLGLSKTLSFAFPVDLQQWSLLAVLALSGFTMQFLLTTGLAVGGRGSGARATNMIYTQMLFAMFFDKLIFSVSPGWWSLAGSGLILGSALCVALMEQSTPRKAGDEEEARGTEEEEMGMLGTDGREISDEDD